VLSHRLSRRSVVPSSFSMTAQCRQTRRSTRHTILWCDELTLWPTREGVRIRELQIFRTQDLSFPRTKGPYGEPSFPRNESSRNFRFWDLSFPGTFVLGERKFPGTFVPGPFRSRELSFPENESSWELSFLGPFVPGNLPGNFRSHYPIGLVAALLCVFNYCMFGCDFTLMMLTPL